MRISLAISPARAESSSRNRRASSHLPLPLLLFGRGTKTRFCPLGPSAKNSDGGHGHVREDYTSRAKTRGDGGGRREGGRQGGKQRIANARGARSLSVSRLLRRFPVISPDAVRISRRSPRTTEGRSITDVDRRKALWPTLMLSL